MRALFCAYRMRVLCVILKRLKDVYCWQGGSKNTPMGKEDLGALKGTELALNAIQNRLSEYNFVLIVHFIRVIILKHSNQQWEF